MTKSPRVVARESLPAYSSKYSRRDFTQHQLFAVLALETFLKTDYRWVVAFLDNFAELRDGLGLGKVPDYSTLCYAKKRLLQKGCSSSSSSALSAIMSNWFFRRVGEEHSLE